MQRLPVNPCGTILNSQFQVQVYAVDLNIICRSKKELEKYTNILKTIWNNKF